MLAAKQSIDEQLPSSEFMGPFIDDMSGLDPLQVAAGDQAAEDQVDREIPAAGAAPNDALLLPPSRDPTAIDDTGDPLSDVLAAQTDSALSLPAELSAVGRTVVVHNRAGMGPNGFFPSDSTGSAGTRYYVEMVNDRIEVFRLSDLAHVSGPMTTQAFTRSPATSSVGDVQIQWDPVARRWLYLADRLPGVGPPRNGSDYLAYGWSKTSSPRDLANGWCHFFYRSPGSDYDDFPKLGHSNGAMIFGSDLQTPRNSLITPRIFIVTKPSASAASSCQTPRVRVFGSRKHPLMPAGTLAPIPVNLQQSSSLGYVVAAQRLPFRSQTGTQLTLWKVSGNGSNGRLSTASVPVDGYRLPADVPQPRTHLRLDAQSGVLTQAVGVTDPLAGGLAIWTQHTIARDAGKRTRSQLRWYELLPTAAAPQVRQQGDVSTPGDWVFNGAITPTRTGTSAIVTYNVGSGRMLVRARARSRGPTAPLRQMVGEVTLARSASSNRDLSCFQPGFLPGVCRWGDYAGASPDARLAGVLLGWGTNMLEGPLAPSTCHFPNSKRKHPCVSWRTQNFELAPSL